MNISTEINLTFWSHVIHPSVTDPVESTLVWVLRENVTGLVYFSTGISLACENIRFSSLFAAGDVSRLVFFLTCILPIKVKRGGRLYTFTANLNAFYLKLLRMEKIKLNDSHFFMPDWFTYPSVFCFCRWCFIFLLLLIKYEQWNIWSFRSNTKKWPRTQKISRVETNYSPGIGEAKCSLGLHN